MLTISPGCAVQPTPCVQRQTPRPSTPGRGVQFVTSVACSASAWARCISSRGRGSHFKCVARRATREAPPRPPREDPTPFPREPIFPPEPFRLLELFSADEPDAEDLIDALEDFQELHETDRHWGRFPSHVADCRKIAYNKGQLQIVQGILQCMEQETNDELRTVALEVLLTLMIGGSTRTRCPPTLVLEAGAVGVLSQIADQEDITALEILLELARMAPDFMLPDIIEQGAANSCLKVLDNSGAAPMDQLTALNLLFSLTKRAPAPIAASGAYDIVKGVTNVALIPRRNKIMNYLRPLVEHEGDTPALTNIRRVLRMAQH
ncbi:unnamed protein product [Effrenium voratum]|nr:unnamed protein product [Effrenium voratum]